MGALSGLPADRVPPGIEKLAGKAALLRYFLSENHRGGVRHRIRIADRPIEAAPHVTVLEAINPPWVSRQSTLPWLGGAFLRDGEGYRASSSPRPES